MVFDIGGIDKFAAFVGNGGQQSYNITHGMTPTPDYVFVGAGSSNAAHNAGVPLSFYWTWNSTTITVTYNAATAAGAGSVTLLWIAGYRYGVRKEIRSILKDTEEN